MVVRQEHASEGSQVTGGRTDPYPPTVEYVDGVVVLLDQAALPEVER